MSLETKLPEIVYCKRVIQKCFKICQLKTCAMSLACAILVISVQGVNIGIQERKRGRGVGFQIVLNCAEKNIEIKKYRSKYQRYIEL